MLSRLRSTSADVTPTIHTKHLRQVRLEEHLPDAMEDLVKGAQRAVKRGRYAVEDLMEDAVHAVKHRPLAAVALSFGLGSLTGAILGSMAARNCRK